MRKRQVEREVRSVEARHAPEPLSAPVSERVKPNSATSKRTGSRLAPCRKPASRRLERGTASSGEALESRGRIDAHPADPAAKRAGNARKGGRDSMGATATH
jgi:hypothetical protein